MSLNEFKKLVSRLNHVIKCTCMLLKKHQAFCFRSFTFLVSARNRSSQLHFPSKLFHRALSYAVYCNADEVDAVAITIDHIAPGLVGWSQTPKFCPGCHDQMGTAWIKTMSGYPSTSPIYQWLEYWSELWKVRPELSYPVHIISAKNITLLVD